MNSFDYVRNTYGVPACIGRVVVVAGKRAVITADRGHYIGITFDTDRPSIIRNAHPTSEVQYTEELVRPRRLSRSERRYQDYVNDDSGLSFREWLAVQNRRKP